MQTTLYEKGSQGTAMIEPTKLHHRKLSTVKQDSASKEEKIENQKEEKGAQPSQQKPIQGETQTQILFQYNTHET